MHRKYAWPRLPSFSYRVVYDLQLGKDERLTRGKVPGISQCNALQFKPNPHVASRAFPSDEQTTQSGISHYVCINISCL